MRTKDFTGIRNGGPLPSPLDVEIPDDIGDLLGDYIESTDSMLEELEQTALSLEVGRDVKNNIATAKRVLHKIKGESSMVGFDDVADFCHKAEDAIEELNEKDVPEMLLRFKDWVSTAAQNLIN